MSHTYVAGNTITFTEAGVLVDERARKTFITGNEFHRVDTPIADAGARTIIRDNKTSAITAEGQKISPLEDRQGSRDFGGTPASATQRASRPAP